MARPIMTTLLSNLPERYIPNDARPSLLGHPRETLAAMLAAADVPEKQRRMRARQLWHWIYHRGATDFASMTDLSKDLRVRLEECFQIGRPEIAVEQQSTDGTMKWLLRLAPDERGQRHEIECVYIPEEDRGTLCISSQVGCTLTCSFCHTGTQKLVRNLTAAEIVGQIMLARDRIKDWPDDLAVNPKPPLSGRYVTNVVLMGMGEPLYNFDHVKQAMDIASDGEGISLSKRRITLSTSGVVPEIVRAGDEIGTSLAISLHGTTDDIRNKLVPLNKKYPLAVLMEACRNYPLASNARRITFEYVMLKGVNDTLADAKRLVKLLEGIPAKVNLIPFNPWPGTQYECSEWDTIEEFAEVLNKAGYASPVRTPRGRDIMAACGQLKSDSQKLTARARMMADGE
jgi:23S rRNA (adenine2503-C2)-methyltransferase